MGKSQSVQKKAVSSPAVCACVASAGVHRETQQTSSKMPVDATSLAVQPVAQFAAQQDSHEMPVDAAESSTHAGPNEGHVRIIFIGNPGAGKSTLLNCLAGGAVFKAGLSTGTGLTSALKWVNDDERNWALGDTPGLDDVKNREKAAKEITKGLREDGEYKLFFFVKLDGGRIRKQDMSTIRVVMDSIKNAVDEAGLADEVDGGHIPYHVIINGLPFRDYASSKAAASLTKSIQCLASQDSPDAVRPLAGTLQVTNINPDCSTEELEACFSQLHPKCVVDHKPGNTECKVRVSSSALAQQAVARFNDVELCGSKLTVALYTENLAALQFRRSVTKISDAVPSKRRTEVKVNPVLTVLDLLKEAAGHEPDSLICVPVIEALDDEDNAIVRLPDKFVRSISEATRLKIKSEDVEDVIVEDYDNLQEKFLQQQKQFEEQDKHVQKLQDELQELRKQNSTAQLQLILDGFSRACELGFKGVQVGLEQHNHAQQKAWEERKWAHEVQQSQLKSSSSSSRSAPVVSDVRGTTSGRTSRASAADDARERVMSSRCSIPPPSDIRYTASGRRDSRADISIPASGRSTFVSPAASTNSALPVCTKTVPQTSTKIIPPGVSGYVKNRAHALDAKNAVDYTDYSNRRQ